MIIECMVWCVSDVQAIDLGLPEGDEWMPFAFDLSQVVAIKLCGENDFLGSDKPTIYINGSHVTIDIPYEAILSQWKKLKNSQ